MEKLNGDGFRLAPTLQRILDALSDGYAHLATELEGLLYDPADGQERLVLSAHISRLRRILRPKGEDIVLTRRDGQSYYVHVRLLASPYRS